MLSPHEKSASRWRCRHPPSPLLPYPLQEGGAYHPGHRLQLASLLIAVAGLARYHPHLHPLHHSLPTRR